MVVDIDKILKELMSYLENDFKSNFTGLVLFGSYAKGNAKSNSDIDILITFKKLPKTRYERHELLEDFLNKLEDDYNVLINPIIAKDSNLEKSFLLIDIAQYAKILVDKRNKINKIFKDINKGYKEGVFKKIIRNAYYVLKVENA